MIYLTSSNPESWSSLLQRAQNTDIQDNGKIQKLLDFGITTENARLEHQAQRLLQLKLAQHSKYPFQPVQNGFSVDQLMLGVSPTGSPIGIRSGELMKHLLAVGQSGSGKTTLFYNLMSQARVPFWSFDRKKDYRHLLNQRDGLVVLPWDRLKFNPLKPPNGVGPHRWAQVFSEIFSHSTDLLSGSTNYLLKQVIQLYKLYDLFTENSPPYPSLHELELLIEEEKLNYVRKAFVFG